VRRFVRFASTSYPLFLLIILTISCSDKKEEKNYKIFKYNQDTDVSSLDPAFARSQGNIYAVNQLYNGLVELNNKLEVAPALAESWTISPDGKIYTFKIRKGVKFHDSEDFTDGKGREVTAKDFVFSYKRIIDKKTASPGAWIFNDKILMANDSTVSDTCFKAIDDYTFAVYLNKSYPPFLQILTTPYGYVVPQEVVAHWDKEFRNHPIGTGPFKFKVWEEKSALIFSKNESYWRKDAKGNPLPYLDGVHISFVNDRNIAFMVFQQQKLDFVSGLDENSRDMVFNTDGTIKPEFVAKFDVTKIPYMNTEYLGFQLDPSTYINNKNHPILNKKVRQALNYSINREQMVQYILNSIGTPGTAGIIPACLFPSGKSPVKGYEYNIEKAQQLLKEAGFPRGKGLDPIKLNTIIRFPYKEIAEFVQREFARIGVKLEIETTDYPTLLEMGANGRINFFRASWTGDYSDAENYLQLLYSKNFSPGGSNRTRFKNEKFDALYEQALVEQSIEKRNELYVQMDNIAMEDAPMVILFYDEVVRLTQKKVKGLEANAMNSLILEQVDFKE
jgi:ABC-type transport system substrate-binding protein